MSFIRAEDKEFIISVLNSFFDKGFKEAFLNEKVNRWYSDNKEDFFETGIDFIFNGTSKYVIEFEEIPECVIKISRKGLEHDYCKIEADNFKKAVNLGLDCYFARTEVFTEIEDVVFYIQEKVTCDVYEIESEMYNYADQICVESRELMEEDEYNDLLWEMIQDFDCETSLNAVFGESYETQLLIDFCGENRINDLHQGNFGYKNEFPVIIDFCGFFG